MSEVAIPSKAKDRLNELSASDAARLIAGGDLSSEALVRDCLARIDAREATVRAWAFLDPELALRQARERDRTPARGALHGVPIGVKDVFDTADMPTQMGSPIYAGWRPPSDAACVALMRAAGAVVLGKTVTAEFAGMTPGDTRNPHDPSRTPGGSSSGSAAAVADFMVPLALGTQTGGSVLRPASFCGIVGYKPSFGRYNRSGLKMAAESLDTIGSLARSIEDVELVDAVLLGAPPRKAEPLCEPPRIGVCRTHLWETAKPETMAAVEDSAARLARARASVREVALPEEFAGLTGARDWSAASSARARSPTNGTTTATASASGCGNRWSSAHRRLTRSTPGRSSWRRDAASASLACSRTSTCSLRPASRAKRRRASSRPASRAFNGCGRRWS